MSRAAGGKEPKERGSEVLKSLLATLIGVVIALVLAELFVRIFFDEAVQPRYVIDSGYGVRWNKANVDTHHYVPGDYEVRIRTNSAGMRGTREYPIERVPGKRRILLLGDSFVFGYGVEDDEVVSSVLEDMLNAGQAGGSAYEVLNLGVSGFGQAEELVTWESRGKQYLPDVVVLFYFENDIGNNAVSQLYALQPDGTVARTGKSFLPGTNLQDKLQNFPLIGWLFEHSEAWNLVRNRLSSLVQKSLMKKQGLTSYADTSSDAVVLTAGLLRKLADEVRASGAVPVFVAVPDKRTMRSSFPLSMEEVTELGAKFIDGRELLVPSDYYQRDSHWRPIGHRKVAQRLGAMIDPNQQPQ